VVIFFRAPGERGISKKPLEPAQRPTNPYMGWAIPPTVPTDPAGHTKAGGSPRIPPPTWSRGSGRRACPAGVAVRVAAGVLTIRPLAPSLPCPRGARGSLPPRRPPVRAEGRAWTGGAAVAKRNPQTRRLSM
jgi:hypothetical protein